MEVKMEVLREVINSNKLKTLFSIPKHMENMEVEVIVLPLRDKNSNTNEKDVIDTLKSITGIIPDTGKTLEDYRTERLREHESIN